MPKFNGQNKKRIDPRYFLNETTNRDEDLEEAISSKFDGEMDRYNSRMKPGRDMMSDPSYKSGYTGNSDSFEIAKDEVEKTLQMMLDDGRASGLENEFADVVDGMMAGKLTDIDVKSFLDEDPQGEMTVKEPEEIKAAAKAIYLKMNTKGADSDGDGSSDKEELMKIARSLN